MIPVSAATFITATGLYLLAAGAAVRYLWSENARALRVAFALTAAAAGLMAATFAARWLHWQLIPLTSMFDSLCAFIFFSSIIALFVVKDGDKRALLCFYLPPLAVLAAVAALTAPGAFGAQPRQLREAFLVIHVGLALLAYALFLVASVTSAAYLFQARNLKRRQTTGLFNRLPSLAQLDATLYRLISYGYPFFAVTLVLGVVWAYVDRQLLGDYWYVSPKVLLSFAMMAFYAVTFHTRRFGLLRGPKLATLVLGGFSGLLALYLILGMMRLNTYYFWGAAS